MMSHRHPLPPGNEPTSLGPRLWAGLIKGLQVGLVMSLIAWINWLACGPTEDFRYHVTSTGEDQLRGALVFFELSVITSGLLAAAKPACTSRVRCALVGAGIGFADGLVTVPLLLDRSALTGTGIAFAAGTAALGAIAGSAFLWDTARRGDAWRWPF